MGGFIPDKIIVEVKINKESVDYLFEKIYELLAKYERGAAETGIHT